jgi:hypothetical protein
MHKRRHCVTCAVGSKPLYVGLRTLNCRPLCPLQSDELGRAIAEAVSRWLPTAAARVQYRVWSSGICGGQSGAGAGFLRVLRFPLPFIPPNSPSSHNHPGEVQ